MPGGVVEREPPTIGMEVYTLESARKQRNNKHVFVELQVPIPGEYASVYEIII